MAQMISSESITSSCADGKSSYELLWTIPNWRAERRHANSINSQKAIFETGTSSWFQTKWLVGFKTTKPSSHYTDSSQARLFWQLLDIRGTHKFKLEANVQSQLLTKEGTTKHKNENQKEVSFGETIEETKEFVEVLPYYGNDHVSDSDYLYPDGSIMFKLVVTLKNPTMNLQEYHSYQFKHFFNKSDEQVYSNFAAILDDASTADFKIVTSDEVELLAHKTILKAQCPVFAGMLNSDLSESSSGVVRVDDSSAKTMKVILHYFYTGDLLINDNVIACNIVELTYAAGKYQMTHVLELLDGILGWNEEQEVSYSDVQLLSLAGKLSLKKAEAKLLEIIVAKIQKVTTSEALYELFGYEKEEIFEIAEKLVDEKFGEVGVMEIMDYLLGGTAHSIFLEIGLPFLALLHKRSLKNFEKKLLQLFASTAKKFKRSDELFAVFGHGKQMK